jgi:CO/xanthine dehydrogenase FAD-binding subunit
LIGAFEYMTPASLEEALQVLGERPGSTRILAGGTDLLVQMKEGTVRPKAILDLGGLDQLRGIRRQEDCVWIGPLTTHWQLAQADLIREHGLALVQGAAKVGSPQIRFRGTIGGNMANASPAADTIPPLVILEAEVEISSRSGSRWVMAQSLIQGPAQTVLRPDELITGLKIPLRDGSFRSQYEKFGSRNALSIAVASVAVGAVQQASRLSSVNIALGSVSPTVIRATRAEELLEGSTLSEELIARATAAAGEQCCPIDDVRGSAQYRRQLVGVMLNRILSSWKDDDSSEGNSGPHR